MVVSDEYHFVFVEVPHTASHSIAPELCRHYGGRRILKKHSNLTQFMACATKGERSYFKFAAIRHPLDAVVTDYFKLKGNHKGQYTNPEAFIENGGHVTVEHRTRFTFTQGRNVTFAAFFREFHNRPYNNWFLVAHDRFDYVIRFENLQNDYRNALTRIGVDVARELPHTNPTRLKKRHFLEFYTPEIREQAIRCFGPFMKKWGYRFPDDWGRIRVPTASMIRFHALDKGVGFASRFLQLDADSPHIKRVRRSVERLL